MIVRRRDELPSGNHYVVDKLTARTATVRRLPEGGSAEKVPLKLLASMKQVWEPVFPGLRSVDRVSRSDFRHSHAVINGENFHALQLLSAFTTQSVDCIYIDLPYNTGMVLDWKYNNRFVDKSDGFRHSTWLSFMERRLMHRIGWYLPTPELQHQK
jgi:adenine-specific DNA-methyltransferase